MANVLTDLLLPISEALEIVSRELVGFIPAVALNADASRVAKGQSVVVPLTRATTAVDLTPAVTPPDSGDQTMDNAKITLTKSRMVPIRWNGEQQLGMRNSGSYAPLLQRQFEQAFRTIANEVETDCFVAAYQAASRAYGTAGSAPFGIAGDLSDAAQLARILDDNGAPASDRHLVMGSAAVANLRGKQTILLKANEKGDDDFRRTGAISTIPLDGFTLHNSAAAKVVTKGTGASYVTNGATAAGVDQVVLKTGTGTVLAGDVVTFAGDTVNKYVVNGGIASAGTITLGNPGLLVAIADANAMTIGGSYTPNVAFERNAIQLVTRAPARPIGPNGRPMDLAVDSTIVTDPVSGLAFDVSIYQQYHQIQFQVSLVWGVQAIQSEHIATLIG